MRLGRRSGPGLAGLLIILVVVLLTDARDRGSNPDGPAGSPPAEAELPDGARAEVVRVVDGDTIAVNVNGRDERVRYIGVDTPETVQPGAPVDCFGPQASSFNKGLVEGETVRLEFDRELRDRFGRLLAYVYVGGTFVNAELIRGGYARTLEIEPNTAEAERLARLESEAGGAGRGLWSAC
ncbi:MAG TPA: thermonuclease family protein [Solirubrobacterales bacterium]|nr:thermonuclease family protein [Solirubrobacterales bacterium]